MLSIDRHEPRPPQATGRVRALDGAQIAYRIVRRAPPGSKRMVLAGPLGLPRSVLASLIDPLSERFEVLTWDYRGLYGSGPPRRGTTQPFGVSRQSSDLLSIFDAEGWDRASIVGWGFGAQVALDFARVCGERTQRLALVCGGPKGSAGIAARTGLRSVALRLLGRLARDRAMTPHAARWLKRLGLVGHDIDEAALVELAEAYADQPFEVLDETGRAAQKHDLTGSLGLIDAPTLVVAGDRDPLVPKAAAQQMARALPRAELLIVRGGSHLAPLEYPELLQLRLAAFFAEGGLG